MSANPADDYTFDKDKVQSKDIEGYGDNLTPPPDKPPKKHNPKVAMQTPAEKVQKIISPEGQAEQQKRVETIKNSPPTFSSAYVTMKDRGYGYFVTPDGITWIGEDKGGKYNPNKVADGWAVIREIQTKSLKKGIETTFVIVGKPQHGKEFEFSIEAKGLATRGVLLTELTRRFGTDDCEGLRWSVIKALSTYVKETKLVDRPQWMDGALLAPGLNTECGYDIAEGVNIDFKDVGDVDEGLEALEAIYEAFSDTTPVLLSMAILGAPIVALLWPNNRFGVFVAAPTQTYKTTLVMLLLSLIGHKHNDQAGLWKWNGGATINSINNIAGKVGPFPLLVDNFKVIDKDDIADIQKMVHAQVEGGSKHRLDQEADQKATMEYNHTLIITGENYPGQDSGTRARLIYVPMDKPTKRARINYANDRVKDLNALGKEVMLWLSSQDGKKAMIETQEKFNERRERYMDDLKDSPNTDRIATNATTLKSIWSILKACPILTELMERTESRLDLAIEDHLRNAALEVRDNMDGAKFIDWLRGKLLTGELKVDRNEEQQLEPRGARFIGHRRNTELLIAPSIFNTILVPECAKACTGAKPEIISLKRQLKEAGYVKYNEKLQEYTFNREIDKRQTKMMVFSWSKIMEQETEPTGEKVGSKEGAT